MGRRIVALIWFESVSARLTEPGLVSAKARYCATQASGTVLAYLSRRMNRAPRVTATASGSTSVTRLVEKGLGYAIVPEWRVGQGDQGVGAHPADRDRAGERAFRL